MANKIMNAAGLIKSSSDLSKVLDFPLDLYMLGSYSLYPKIGNPSDYRFKSTDWNWNNIALHNPGISSPEVIEAVNILKTSNKPFWISIAAEEDIVNTKKAISYALAYGPAGIEVNISCPNFNLSGDIFWHAQNIWLQFMYSNIDIYFKLSASVFEFQEVELYKFISLISRNYPFSDKVKNEKIEELKPPPAFGLTSSNSIKLPIYNGGYSGKPLFTINKIILETLSNKYKGSLNLMAVGGVSSIEEITQYYSIPGVRLVQVGSEYTYQGRHLFSQVYS